MDLIIEGDPAELEWLRRHIQSDVGPEAKLQALPDREGEELREPLTIALIVALGGPALTQSIADVLKRRYEHKEEIERIRNELRVAEAQYRHERAQLRLLVGQREVTEVDLALGRLL